MSTNYFLEITLKKKKASGFAASMPSTLIYRELFGFYRKLSVSKTSSYSATGEEKNLNSKSKKFCIGKKIMLRFFFFFSLCHLTT